MVLSANGSSKTVTPVSDFTTQRLLCGNFQHAEACLCRGLEEIGVRRFFRFGKPTLHIYPKEMTEGGLSSVEERVFRELGISAGAKKVEIHL